MLRLIRYEEGEPIREGADIRSIQEMLIFLGFHYSDSETERPVALVPDGKYGPNTERAIENFQSSEGLIRDGIVGPQTMNALRKAWMERQQELNIPTIDFADAMPDRLTLDRIEVDQWGDGYSAISLRCDAAGKCRKVRKELKAAGAILTTSGGIRSLDATVNRSRSPVSLHYLGRAIDLFIYSGMVDPETDPYVIVREKPRHYRVYARCLNPEATSAPDETTMENIVTYDKKHRKGGAGPVTGRFIDLTKLFAENGFYPIPAKKGFEEGRSQMGAEWWHFQYQEGLIGDITTFGSELLKIYSKRVVENTPPWKERERVWGINWS